MATVTGYTADRMKAIEDSAVVGGHISVNNLILERFDEVEIDAGNVRGPVGPQGPGPVPVGTIIMGGWATDPAGGYLLLNGQTVLGGKITYPELALAYPGWVSANNLILPDTTGSVPMAAAVPGVVSGSMTHVLGSGNLPPHAHTSPQHSHNMSHFHGYHSYLTLGTGVTMVSGSSVAINAVSTVEPDPNTTGLNAASNTGNGPGASTPVNHTPKNLSVIYAVKRDNV